MHIGLLIYGSLSTVSGGYLYDQKLVERLTRRGSTVEVVSLPWRSYPQHLADNFSTSLLMRLAGLPVDILLQDELNHPSLFRINRRLREKVSYPILSIVHHLRSSEDRPAWQNRFYRIIERAYLNSVDGFLFNSQTTRREVNKLIPVQKPCVVATPAGDRLEPGITRDEVLQRANQTGPLRLLFLGNVIPRKSLHTVINALSRLPRGEYCLEVVGSLEMVPGYARLVQQQVTQNGLNAQVSFKGRQENVQLADILRACHLLVLPSSYEGYGIAYLEGMSFGLPAIGTTRGAAGELIHPGENGFLISPGDAEALAALLRSLAAGRPALARLSLGALEFYKQHPGWEQSMNTAVDFLESFHSSSTNRKPS